MTDYLDGETNEIMTNEIEGHLAVCPACRQFEQSIHNAAREPFEYARRIKPPEVIWNRVKEGIGTEEGSRAKSFPARIHSLLQYIFATPKTAFAVLIVAVSALVMMVILSDFHLNHKRAARARFAGVQPLRQVKYLSDVMEEPEHASIEENDGYGTAIEEYFL
ncbi:MAG: zf-HC2 domain-containing protein [bacterium]